MTAAEDQVLHNVYERQLDLGWRCSPTSSPWHKPSWKLFLRPGPNRKSWS
jgi:hypothetical protein